MNDSRYTYEEMEIARFTDLPNLAEAFGYEVQARGRWHFLKDAQHIVIKNRTRYFDNYKQEWGDAITFLEDYADMSFREAMDFLLNYNGYARLPINEAPTIKMASGSRGMLKGAIRISPSACLVIPRKQASMCLKRPLIWPHT